jgi:DNA-directed RNA polymerase sigma subunit (sigma70/sigma32)
LSTEQVDARMYARRLKNASARVVEAKTALEDNVRAANSAGLSLRTIAVAAGLSHERVRQIVKAGE